MGCTARARFLVLLRLGNLFARSSRGFWSLIVILGFGDDVIEAVLVANTKETVTTMMMVAIVDTVIQKYFVGIDI